MMNEWIWLDMDGTFADLYGVDSWLECLLAHDPTPYKTCKCLYNEGELLDTLLSLKVKGYSIGVISWSTKEKNEDFDRKVAQAKKDWLFNKCFDLLLDKVIVTQYGVCKADTCRKYGKGILADDEQQNRDSWDLGATIDANENLIKELKKLLDR